MEIKYRIDLYKLLPKNPVTAELGVAEGYFSEHICKHWKPKLHYSVDNWSPIGVAGDGSFPQEWHDNNYKAATERLKPFGDKVQILRGPSWRMSQGVKDNSFDLVYLDADHSYEGVLKDLVAWFPKVKVGGVIAGHDFVNSDYGVFQAVTEFCNERNYKAIVIPENKDEDAGFYFIKTH